VDTPSKKSFLNAFIVRILVNESSYKNYLSVDEIESKLMARFGLKISKRAIKRSLNALKKCDNGIVYYENVGACYDKDDVA